MKLINYAFKVFWDAGIRLSLIVWVGQAQFEGAAEAAEAGPLPASLAITCPTNVTVQCAAAIPPAATDSASFIAQGGTISGDCPGQVLILHSDATNNQTCPNRFTPLPPISSSVFAPTFKGANSPTRYTNPPPPTCS